MKKSYFILICLLALILTAAGYSQVDVTSTGGTPSASYTTLKGAFDAINAGTHTGTITIGISGNTDEGTSSAVLNASGSGSANYTSVTINPTGGAQRTISGSTTAGNPLIDLNGADNVTFDGLTVGIIIENKTVSATSGTSTIRFINGATNNTITNCSVLGSSTMAVGTNGGNIYFATDASTTAGNDDNTISYCNIGPSGTNLPTKGIYGNGSQTTTAIGNSGININNNKIYDYFGAAVTSAGIYTANGCNTWTITNNKFYQTGTRTWTTGAQHSAIWILSSTATYGAQGFTITYNTIGYASPTGTGTYTLTGSTGKFIGIYYTGISSGTLTNINNNTITAVSLTGVTSSGTSTSSPFSGITVSNGLATTSNNLIGSMSSTGAMTFSTNSTTSTDIHGIYNYSVNDWIADDNQIGGYSITNAAASGTYIFYGMRANTSTSYYFSASNNFIGGTVANSIQLNATGSSCQVFGIYTGNARAVFTSNTVRNLTTNIGTGTGSTASIVGIGVIASSVNDTVRQCTVHTLTNTNSSAAGWVNGINFSGLVTAGANFISRNFIHSLNVASATGAINGIYIIGGTSTYQNNMIRLGVDALGNNITTGCAITGISETVAGTDNIYFNSVYIGGTNVGGSSNTYAFNSSITTNTRSYRNNIFQNSRSNGSGTGKHYGVKVGGTAPNPAGLTINYNVYYVNGTGGVFGFFNSADVASLAAWKTAVGQDVSSIYGDPQFINPTGTSTTLDLHLSPTLTTPAEGNGVDIASVTDDFDGQTRASLSPVDIGADAGNFVGLDLIGPSIVYTNLGNTTSTSNRSFSNVSITDVSGVNTTSGTRPRVYYKRSTDANAWNDNTSSTDGWKWVEANGTSSPFDFTIDYTKLNGGTGVTTGNIVQYFVVAQDLATTPNVNINNGSFAAQPASVDLTSGAFPIGGTINQYSILNAISGAKSVPGDYATLTATGGLFEAINNSIVTGNITVTITGDISTETGAVALNQWVEEGAGNYTLTIQPDGSVERVISGTYAGGLVRLNGADRVTIDGRYGGGGRYLTFINTSTSSGTAPIQLISLGTGAGATNNTIRNCNLSTGAITSTNYGIAIGGSTIGTAGDDNDNVSVISNLITKAYKGIYAYATATGVLNGLQITANTIGSETDANSVGNIGIDLSYASGASITENTIRNLRTGTNAKGIYVYTGVLNSSISRNKIFDIIYTGTSGYGGKGIDINTGNSSSGLTVANNLLYGMSGDGYSGISDNICGIRIQSTTGGVSIWYNSINLYGSISRSSATADVSGALFIVSGASNLDIRNNILVNSLENTTGVAKAFAIYTTATTNALFTTINYNDYYAFGAEGVLGSLNAVDRTTLGDWQTASGQDANSISTDPLFNSNTNLQPQSGSPVVAAGTPVAVTIDYTGTSRSGTTPSIGAYENPTAGDINPPVISYTPMGNTSSTSNRSFTNVSITDPGSGVNTTSGTRPRVYYKRSTDANAWNDNTSSTAGWKWVEANGTSNPFDFTIDYSKLYSAKMVNQGDIIQYFVVAQDLFTTPNVGINSGTFNSAPSSVDLGASQFPITGTINSYTISVAFYGTVQVGTGQTYTSLTNDDAAGLFKAINNGVLTGNLTVEIVSNLSETGAIALNQFAEDPDPSNFTITIRPNSATTRTISGSYAGGLIRLNGADRVTFDGRFSGSGSYLTVSNTSTSSSAVFQLISLGAGQGATNNTIRNCNISTGVINAVTYGVHLGGSTMGSSGADNDANTILNNTITVASNGIYASGTVATNPGALDELNISGNSVTCSTSVQAIGIRLLYAMNCSIAQNTLDIQQSVSNAPVGISVETGVTITSVTRNFIKRSAYTGTGGYGGRGIVVGTGSTSSNITIVNNVIYGVTGDNWSSFGAASSMGIAIGVAGSTSTLTTTTGGVEIYYNSVNMYGNYSRATACVTTAIYVGSGSSNLNIRNNIFANSMDNTNVSYPSKSYAVYSAVANTAFTSINYNDYYASGAEGVLGFLTTDKTDLTAWQGASGQDLNSITVNPSFMADNNLQINVGSPVIGAGTPISGITTDILGITRSLTSPTIGAYENGTDAPVINYTALLNTTSTSNRTLSGVTITTSSIPVDYSSNKPRIYFKKSTDANVFGGNTSTDNGWKWTETSSGSSPSSFTIDYSIINGGSVSAGDYIQYFVVAQNTAGTPEVSSNPSAGFVATSVSSITSAPTTPNQYKIIGPPLGGDYTVGTSMFNKVTGLKLTAQKFTKPVTDNSPDSPEALEEQTNASVQNRTDKQIYEAMKSMPAEGASGSEYYALVNEDGTLYKGPLFAPSNIADGPNGVYATLTAALTDLNERGLTSSVRFLLTDATYNEAGQMVVFVEADNKPNASRTVTIKPNTGVTANINVNSTGAVLVIGNDYIIIDGSNTNGGTSRDLTIANAGTGASAGVIFVSLTTNVTIKNIIAMAKDSSTAYGIVYDSSAYGLIQNCEVKRTALGIQSQTGSTNFVVRNCDVGSSVDGFRIMSLGISILSSQGFTIDSNRVFGVRRSGSASIDGILVGNQTSGSQVQNGVISRNFIYDIKNTGTGSAAYGARGIRLSAGLAAADVTCVNNMITDIWGDGDAGTQWNPHGIYISSGGGYKIYFNTIKLFGALNNTNAGNSHTSAIIVYHSTATNLDIRNNIFYNSQTILTGTSYAYAIYSASANTAFSDINYNNYYSVGANAMLGYLATNAANISAWQAATGKDSKSNSANVSFVSATDLHLTGGSIGDKNLQGTAITGHTTDFDNQNRHAAYPYMGADEVTTTPLALTLNLTVLIQGFMNPGNTAMVVGDTVTVRLRAATNPYAIIDEAKAFVGTNGVGTFYFGGSSQNATNYYLQIKHRNGLETWSAAASPFSSYAYTYNFTTAASQAFGSNMIQKGSLYCIYNGDVNQDGQITLDDMLIMDADNQNFVTGYTVTDVNGDDQVTLDDLLMTDENNQNFVSKQTPAGILKPVRKITPEKTIKNSD